MRVPAGCCLWFYNFILNFCCDLFMGLSARVVLTAHRVTARWRSGDNKNWSMQGRERPPPSPATLPSVIISMQMIWAQQVKIMQYHIFCLPTLLMNLFPWVGWGGEAGRGVGAPHANARVKWAEADTMKISSPQFLHSLARDLISSSPALGTIFLHYIISEIMESQWAAGTRSLAAGLAWS